MSLAILNENKDVSDEYRKGLRRAWGPVRILQAASEESGEEILLPLYTALGTRFHNEGRRGEPEVLVEALADVGLRAGLVAAAESSEYDEAIAKSHHAGMGLVGEDVGTPVLSVGYAAIFGPVVSPIPRGEAAGKLWDGVMLVIKTDGFFELKRSRDRRPSFE